MKDAELILDGATRVRVQFLAQRAVRVTHADLGADVPPDRPWLADVLLPQQETTPEACELSVKLEAGRVVICARDGQEVLREARIPQLGVRRRGWSLFADIPSTQVRLDRLAVDDAIRLCFRLEPGEALYGWGEWFNAFRRGRGRLRLQIRDAFAQLQPFTTYSGLPVFLSSRGYLLWLLNSHVSEWDIDPERGELRVEALGPGADYILIHGSTFRDLITAYTALTGRPPLIPRWAFGLMVTGYPQEHQSVMQARVQEHRQRRIPLDALILDYHWEERFHNFRWRSALFPDPDGLIADLRRQGVRLGLILTPFVNSRNRPGQRALLNFLAHNQPPGCEHDDERDLEGYAEAQAGGHLAHPAAKWWFGQGGMIDFSSPAAAAWWNRRMRSLYEQGAAFFKNDDGEYLPPDGRGALGLEAREYHNLYGFFYGRALYDGMAELDDRRPFIYARSVWAGSQRYPAVFLGDQKPTFAHMRSALRAGLNLGLVGFAYWTADVFGLDGRTTPETHMRYAQWALLAPVARYFWRPPGIDATRFPWSHGPQAEASFRRIAELRYRLLPYYCALAWEAHLTGVPILRPMLLEFQADKRFADVDDQAMLGADLLLAPVLEAGAARRHIRLPGGTWHDWWSTQSYSGAGEADYPAPLDHLPLLVRGGCILPLGPPMQHIADGHVFDRLQLHVWPPFPAAGVLYDDDGRSRAYQRGAFSVTRFTAARHDRQVTVRVGRAEGGFPEQVAERDVEVVLQRCPAPAGVRVEGQPLNDWEYSPDSQTLTIPVRCPVGRETEISVKLA